jgi:hypothetical protein
MAETEEKPETKAAPSRFGRMPGMPRGGLPVGAPAPAQPAPEVEWHDGPRSVSHEAWNSVFPPDRSAVRRRAAMLVRTGVSPDVAMALADREAWRGRLLSGETEFSRLFLALVGTTGSAADDASLAAVESVALKASALGRAENLSQEALAAVAAAAAQGRPSPAFLKALEAIRNASLEPIELPESAEGADPDDPATWIEAETAA